MRTVETILFKVTGRPVRGNNAGANGGEDEKGAEGARQHHADAASLAVA